MKLSFVAGVLSLRENVLNGFVITFQKINKRLKIRFKSESTNMIQPLVQTILKTR